MSDAAVPENAKLRRSMRRLRLLFLSCALCGIGFLSAQDVHYSLHNMSPMWLNPAKTGDFNATARIGGIYRGQWYSVSGISTPNIYVDAPIIRGLRDQDWIGVGFSLIADNAGDNRLNTTNSVLSAAYHLALDEDRDNVLTLGAQYASVSVSLNPRNFLAQDNIAIGLGGGGMGSGAGEFMGGTMGGGGNMDAPFNDSYTGVNAGLMLRSRLADDNLLEVGFSMLHIGSPRLSLLTGGGGTGGGGGGGGGVGNVPAERRRPATIHAHATLDYGLSDKWRFLPTVFFQQTRSTSTASIQAWAGRQVNEDVMLKFGLGYRTADAGKVLFGIDYKDVRAALAYDIPLGQTSPVDDNLGAFELSAYYLLRIYKQPEVTPKILCPRL